MRRESGAQPEPTLAMERAYGSGGELLYTIDANGQRTSFWYDGAGHPVAIRNVNGGLITASYNNAGERVSVEDPDRGTWSFRYNGFGELVHQQDARLWGGIDFFYDALGRPTQRTWIDADPLNAGAPQSMRDEWYYDSFGGESARGQLVFSRRQRTDGPAASADLYERQVRFDALKRPIREEVKIGRPGGAPELLPIDYAYDARFGRLKSRTLPGLETVYYGYSADTGQLIETGDAALFTAPRNPGNGYYQRIDAIDAFGHATSIALRGTGLGAPAVRTDMYDESTGLLTRTDTPGILSIAYRYDAYGNLTEQRDLASDRSERYGYDALQRLTTSTRNGAGSSGSTSYTYDKLGNFITKGDFSTSNGYTYAAGKSQVQSVSMVGANSPSVAYAYDANGNVVTRTASDPALSLAIGYDIDNHALTIRRPASGNGQATDNGSTFRYGPDGQRYFQEMRQPGQSARQLIYLGKDYEKEYTGSGQVERWYLPGGAVRIRSTDPAVASGTYVIHGDRLGSTSVMTDKNGQVIGEERRAFDAFGRPRAWDNWNVTEGANATPARNTTLFGPRNRRGFTQHEHVDRTNIIHMNGRIFDAELGRFYGVDPFVQFPSNSQSLNPYSYVLNNPMAGTDPTGYKMDCVGMTGAACTMPDAKPQLQVRKGEDGKLFAVATDGKGNMLKVESVVAGNGSGKLNLTQGVLQGLEKRDLATIGAVAARFNEPGAQLAGTNYNKELGNKMAGSYFGGFAKSVLISAALTTACATTTFGAAACLAFGAGQMEAGDPSGATFVLAGAGGASLRPLATTSPARATSQEMASAVEAATPKTVTVPAARYPESAAHIADAQSAGYPSVLTINRPSARQQRVESLRGTPVREGADRDEYPPAMFLEGGRGASVRHIDPSDNRGAGACIGAQCSGLPDGSRVRIRTSEEN